MLFPLSPFRSKKKENNERISSPSFYKAIRIIKNITNYSKAYEYKLGVEREYLLDWLEEVGACNNNKISEQFNEQIGSIYSLIEDKNDFKSIYRGKNLYWGLNIESIDIPLSNLFLVEKYNVAVFFFALLINGNLYSILSLFCNDVDHVSKFVSDFRKFSKERRLKKGFVFSWLNKESVSIPSVSWDDIFLPEEMKRDIKSSVETFFGNPEGFQKYGIEYKRGVLFSGPPGNGKTMTCKAIISSLKYPTLILEPTEYSDCRDFIGCYDEASKLAPCLIIIEDLDRLVGDSATSMSIILNTLDGLTTREGILTIATSNNPEMIDPALISRPSRFDKVWRFNNPEYEERKKFLKSKGGEYWDEEQIDKAAIKSEDLSMAYLKEVINGVLLKSVCEEKRPSQFSLVEEVEEVVNYKYRVEKGTDGDFGF